MRLCTHVVKNKLGMYYARVYVPKDLRELVEKAEIRRTLKTTCYATAVERARPVVRYLQNWFADLRREHLMSEKDGIFYTDLTHIGSIETTYADGTKRTIREVQVDGEKEVEIVKELVDNGVVRDVATDNRNVAKIVDSAQSVLRIKTATNSSAIRISEAVERFIDARLAKNKNYRKTTQRNYHYIVDVFKKLYGDLPIDEYTYDIASDFRRVLFLLPNNYRNTAKWRGMSEHEILMHDDLEDAEKLSEKRISDMLKSINAVFKHAIDIGAGGEARVSVFKTIDVAYECSSYQPFTTSDLCEIFDNLPVDRESPSHFWAPLIALHTGMRRSEIFFLTAEDIQRDDDGVWYIDINRNNGKHTKNKASIRKIPVHSKLIWYRFLEFVDDVRAKHGDHGRLFPEYKDHDQQAGYKYSDTFAKFLDEIGIPEKAKTFHSFRSNVINALQDAEVDLTKRNRISGHSNGNTGDDVYGGKYPMKSLQTELEKIDFSSKILGLRRW